jgi:hypothetical protein
MSASAALRLLHTFPDVAGRSAVAAGCPLGNLRAFDQRDQHGDEALGDRNRLRRQCGRHLGIGAGFVIGNSLEVVAKVQEVTQLIIDARVALGRADGIRRSLPRAFSRNARFVPKLMPVQHEIRRGTPLGRLHRNSA